MTYQPGDRIGDYEVLAVLGAGGMGKVYKVRNVISDRVEAMKVLLPNLAEYPELGERFIREIKLQATLNHPNIAALHTALHHENQLLMLMEFVDGITLEELVRGGPLRLEDAIDYIAQVCDALAYAHAKGIIHRDLKPSNMMLTPEGVVKLLDFGIAKFAQDRSMTKTGFLVGSLPYISPEQIEGLPDIDARTDIYSLGITLYQLVTGRVPFEADSEYSLMRKHLQEMPVPPVQLMPDVPQGLNDIILTAIEKDRSRRFQSAAAMGAALRSLGAELGMKLSAQPSAAATPRPAPPPMAPEQAWGAPPPLPGPKSHSNRGVYIVLGSLVTVAVLVVAAMQLPRFFGTRAGAPSPGAEAPAVQRQAAEPDSQPASGSSAEPARTPALDVEPLTIPAPADTRPAGSIAPRPAEMRSGPAAPVRQEQPPRPAETRSAPAAAARQESPSSFAAQPEPAPRTAPEPRAAQEPPAAPAPPVRDEKLFEELREQLMLLGTRVHAAQASLNRLKQEQARMGLGLRGDIAAAAQRMEFHMDEAEAAIKRGDAAAAKRHLDNAERETSRLEKFLGR
ncbi:MAG: protein kinase [Bryobacteraceae bacterium]|nr:protein kinase [Bryobacteraceae bacterium]